MSKDRVTRCAAFIALVVLYLYACSSPTDVPLDPPEGTPQQFYLAADPEIYEPERHPDHLNFIVTAVDSTAHRRWWPTMLLVETDRGFRREIELPPYVCIVPSERADEFPLNFDWWTCNRFFIYNTSVLTEGQIAEVAAATGGRLMFMHEFSFPRVHYDFAVAVGRSAIQQALERLEEFAYVDQAFHPQNEPPCVTSDVLPPPPCPPWFLSNRFPYRFSETTGDTIPVSEGGWVRATYTQPNGTQRATTFRF